MKKILKKLHDIMTWIFKNDSDKPKKSTKLRNFDVDVHYFDAKMFYNDLDNPEDYYLRVSPADENRFVRKDEVDDN